MAPKQFYADRPMSFTTIARHFPTLAPQKGGVAKEWWQMREDYVADPKPAKMTQPNWQRCVDYILDFFEECSSFVPGQKMYYMVADAGRLFFEHYDEGKNWAGGVRPPYTYEDKAAHTALTTASKAIPPEKAAKWGYRKPRGPPKVPRIEDFWCQCDCEEEWGPACTCDFDMPCDCEEDECSETCKVEKRMLAREAFEDWQASAYRPAPEEEKNVACYCGGQPLFLSLPKSADREAYVPLQISCEDEEITLWAARQNYPDVLCYEGREDYAADFLAADPSISEKLLVAVGAK